MNPATLAVVGAGPLAAGLVERIAASAPELWPAGRPLRLRLVDPHPPGAGRVWRHDQSPLLRMNSMAEDVTVFTDASSTVEGPVRPGPSLAEWAAAPRDFPPYRPPRDPAVAEELRTLAPTGFATRRAQGAYLEWAFRRAVAALPPHVTVTVHRTTATALTGPADGPQRVHLADGSAPLEADAVVLAQGHLASVPEPGRQRLAAFARRHRLRYVPPEFSAESDLSVLRPGEPVLLRGFGLASADLTVLLTQGRGGRFTRSGEELVYVPSGREPVLHIGSRRGVPYHAKPGYRLRGERPPLPRYFGPRETGALAARVARTGVRLDLRRDVWPLMAKEIGYGYYHELFHAHPERTALSWPDFLAAYDGLGVHGPSLAALVATAVPDPADRLDLAHLDRPLAGRTFSGPGAFRAHLHRYIAADLARRADPGHSADLGAFLALLSVHGQLPGLVERGVLTAESVARQVDGWWQGFFNHVASGPPGFRLRELLALSRAGVVHFLGAGMEVTPDPEAGVFLGSSASVPGHTVAATALVEAYQPRPTVRYTADPLLAALHRDGRLSEELLTDPGPGRAGAGTPAYRTGLVRTAPEDQRLLDPRTGGPHPRRVALGAPTTGRALAAFARPRTDAPAFRRTDAVARQLLRTLRTLTEPADAPRAGLRPRPSPRPSGV
ncbi:FAD/NAD(P)-binding protein [Streptomyces sp. HNM0574]|uniref:FAD/NAD(P)-binding protein n=1 Tax=Streptomyces sp. HNM0574 TaxID=2714954 RepID=UPI00146C8703|nr:FAD/NAD(P)-binding protein [Streptomyces sp. HNM0574]NLU66171.1 FAD/NAD(P)-binding protein [Streptomyces sp. HNM0574]